MQVLGLRRSGLARDVVVDHAGLQRARPIQGDQRNDLAEGSRLQLHDEIGHARGFDLEYALGVALAEQVVGLRIVDRDRVDVEGLEAGLLADHPLRIRHQGQRLQSQEVELDEADLLDAAHVVLRHHVAGLRVLVERDHLDQGLRSDHDAGRVLGGVAREPLEVAGGVEQALDLGIHVHQCPQLRRLRDRVVELDAQHVGDQLRDPVDVTEGHPEHASDVPDRGFGLKRSESHDLRDLHSVVAPVEVVAVRDLGPSYLSAT